MTCKLQEQEEPMRFVLNPNEGQGILARRLRRDRNELSDQQRPGSILTIQDDSHPHTTDNHAKRYASIDHFGGRIQTISDDFPSADRLWTVVLTLIASLVMVFGGVAVFLFPTLRVHNSFGYKPKPLFQIGSEEDNLVANLVDLDWDLSDSFWLSSPYFTDAKQFQVWLGLFLSLTMIITGLGLELLMLLNYLREGWSADLEKRWKLAEFSFSLLAATCVGLAVHGNYMCLPVGVLAFFKFGFPEVLTYCYGALYFDYGPDRPLQWLVDLMYSVGQLVHHAACTTAICMWLVGIIPADQRSISLTVFLMMQHWFVLVKYASAPLFVVAQFVLEVLFEWCTLSNMEIFLKYYHWSAALTAFAMLVAHWITWAAAITEFQQGIVLKKKPLSSNDSDKTVLSKAPVAVSFIRIQ